MAETRMRYSVYETAAFGSVRVAAVVEADCDRDALKQARAMILTGAGELRQDMRIVCRYGRSAPFLLR
jgi:hypothetical protein